MDQKAPTSPTPEVKAELEVQGQLQRAGESRKPGELLQEESVHVGTQHRALSLGSFGESEKKSKAAGKAAGNPADEEQPLMGLSWQVYFSSTGHLFGMACAPCTRRDGWKTTDLRCTPRHSPEMLQEASKPAQWGSIF